MKKYIIISTLLISSTTLFAAGEEGTGNTPASNTTSQNSNLCTQAMANESVLLQLQELHHCWLQE